MLDLLQHQAGLAEGEDLGTADLVRQATPVTCGQCGKNTSGHSHDCWSATRVLNEQIFLVRQDQHLRLARERFAA